MTTITTAHTAHISIGTLVKNWRRPLQIAAVVAALAAVFLGTFGCLHAIHTAQSAVAETGTVLSTTSEAYVYQCATVGGDPVKGTPGTPIFCDGVQYPSLVSVAGEHVTATFGSEPTIGANVTMWHIDSESWSLVDPHSNTQVGYDLMWASLALLVAFCVGFTAYMIVSMIRES